MKLIHIEKKYIYKLVESLIVYNVFIYIDLSYKLLHYHLMFENLTK